MTLKQRTEIDNHLPRFRKAYDTVDWNLRYYTTFRFLTLVDHGVPALYQSAYNRVLAGQLGPKLKFTR